MYKVISKCLSMVLFLSLILPSLLTNPTAAMAETKVNLALNKSISQSSDCSCGRSINVVDGDPNTFWQPLAADRTDGNVWITVDLGAAYNIDEAVIHFRSGSVSSYSIQTSIDKVVWQDTYVKNLNGNVTNKVETVQFPTTNSRYVKLTVYLAATNGFQLNEFSLYSPEPVPVVLDSVYLTDASGRNLSSNDTISLRKSDTFALKLGGTMSDGTTANLAPAQMEWVSSRPDSVTASTYGIIAGLKEGVSKIIGRATVGNVTKEASVWVDVYDPAVLLVDIQMDHPFMTREVGKPAVLSPGDSYPSVRLLPYEDGHVTASLVNSSTGIVIMQLPTTALQRKIQQMLSFPGNVSTPGNYEIRMEFSMEGNHPVYNTLYFTVQNKGDNDSSENHIAYMNQNGNMTYVPDYLGNRILDFSNAGYMGGGVKIPDVQARIVLAPGSGDDDTARIQEAIDQVAVMPQSAEGIRGAVLLKKGTYRIAGTLYIRSSGVVLRGEGQGEDGTILYATGKNKRNILEIKGQPVKLLDNTDVKIADLFVPSGARSFHVDDEAGYKVGDQIKVRRYGNERWIHAINMDTIHEIDGTVQWTPFELDFDRVITGITNNIITIDAPIANSIERRWGGGDIIKYEDPNRIEQIGVENLRVDSEFDPSVTDTFNGKNYYSDENHAVSFAIFTNVKNAWMREVTGLHLNHSLVLVGRGAKWVTIQDNTSLDMVSVITGGNRYPYDLTGELALMQRNYAETARHAFVVESQVLGPNVFLDSQSVNEYVNSEPHQRWSVGGLYDNVKGAIAIQDRGDQGTGHGWSGANYVTWNTEGALVLQQPPTAQNYAIGHVGTKSKSYLPNTVDQRPRYDGYWESHGTHVAPNSLYLEQLKDRLGAMVVQNIARTPVGSVTLDDPMLPYDLPLLKGIKVNNKALIGFTDTVFEYTLELPAGTTSVPNIRPHDMRFDVKVIEASTLYGKTTLIVRDKKDPSKSVQYQIRFQVAN